MIYFISYCVLCNLIVKIFDYKIVVVLFCVVLWHNKILFILCVWDICFEFH